VNWCGVMDWELGPEEHVILHRFVGWAPCVYSIIEPRCRALIGHLLPKAPISHAASEKRHLLGICTNVALCLALAWNPASNPKAGGVSGRVQGSGGNTLH